MSKDGSGTGAKKRKSDEQNSSVTRSIAACQRCRFKKIKCDRNFPQCTKCTKAGLDCVGIDLATGREVPRSYVFHLEQRVQALESQLERNGIHTPRTEIKGLEASPPFGSQDPYETPNRSAQTKPESIATLPPQGYKMHRTSSATAIPLAATSIGNNSESSYLGASSGITFAKLMMAAVKFQDNKEPSHAVSSINTNTDTRSAVLPPKSTAQNFIRIYFNQSNTQLPILHREVFFKTIFEPIYGAWDPEIPLPSMNTCSGSCLRPEQTWIYTYKQKFAANLAEFNTKLDNRAHDSNMRSDSQIMQTISDSIEVPKQFQRPLYYLNLIFAIASSSNHLQYMNSISEQFRNAAMKFIGSIAEDSDPMEELQSSLLLTLYSLMRPCVDGVWYILGKCLRLCVDLGLHNKYVERMQNLNAHTKDRRRRLFWCTYSLDRQVCFYLGRPVGIPESSISVKFPSVLDDSLINVQDIIEPADAGGEIFDLRAMDSKVGVMDESGNIGKAPDIKVSDYSDYIEKNPSYKLISVAFFQIRQIQSEVQRILYEDEELPRQFDNVSNWKSYIMLKLQNWLKSVPHPGTIANCDFQFEFFLLNYNHTLLMINGLSPKSLKLSPDEFQNVATSSRNIMRCYTQLYVKKSINYTWAAVHNLFMAGTSFLFVLYHSDEICSQYQMHQVMKITGDCISILSSLVVSCDAAKSCSETFQVLAAAVLKLRYDADVDVNCDSNGKPPRPGASAINRDGGNPMDGYDSNNDKSFTIDPRNAFGTLSTGSDGLAPSRNNAQTHVKQEEIESKMEAVSPFPQVFQEAQEEDAYDTEFLNETPDDFVPQFEWISRKSSVASETAENSIYAKGKSLDTFFSEVANLSPISSVKDSSSEKNGPQVEPTTEASTRLPQNEAKKVFELIQQVPTESIWDQFFTKPQSSKSQDNPRV